MVKYLRASTVEYPQRLSSFIFLFFLFPFGNFVYKKRGEQRRKQVSFLVNDAPGRYTGAVTLFIFFFFFFFFFNFRFAFVSAGGHRKSDDEHQHDHGNVNEHNDGENKNTVVEFQVALLSRMSYSRDSSSFHLERPHLRTGSDRLSNTSSWENKFLFPHVCLASMSASRKFNNWIGKKRCFRCVGKCSETAIPHPSSTRCNIADFLSNRSQLFFSS